MVANSSAGTGILAAGQHQGRHNCVRVLSAAVSLSCALIFAHPARCDTVVQSPIFTSATPTIISSDIDPTVGYYTIINNDTGAVAFLLRTGYLGANATLANVEAGYVWNGHETLGNVTSFVSNSPVNATANQYDYHATAVGFCHGRPGPLALLLLSTRHGPRGRPRAPSPSPPTGIPATPAPFSITSSTFVPTAMQHRHVRTRSPPPTNTSAAFSLTYASRTSMSSTPPGASTIPPPLPRPPMILDALAYARITRPSASPPAITAPAPPWSSGPGDRPSTP
jgi:hypothetical protein